MAKKKISIILFSLILLPKLAGLEVVTTTGIVGDIAKNILPQEITYYVMIATGIDPHTYKPKARDLMRIQGAKVILYNGLHLEANLNKIFHKMDKAHPICESIPQNLLIRGDYTTFDPHIWMDPVLWQRCVLQASQILQNNFPKAKEEIKKNTDSYLIKLKELADWSQKQTTQIPKEDRILITAHDAFRYFGKAYQFQVKGIQGISTASEAGIKTIKDIADLVVQKKIPVIFVESSVAKHNIIALQKAVLSRNWQVKIGEPLFSDSMGVKGSGKDNYIGMVKHNINIIVQNLKNDRKNNSN